MRSNTTNRKRMPRVLSVAIGRILPRALRDGYMNDLNAKYTSVSQVLPESLDAVAAGYRIQMASSFDQISFLAQVGTMVFFFAALSLSLPLLIVLGTMLFTLTIRDAYTWWRQGSAIEAAKPPSTAQYYRDSAADIVVTAVSVLLVQAFIVGVLPPVAISPAALLRVGAVCLPVLAVLRIRLRRRLEPAPPEESNMSADRLWKIASCLNTVWLLAVIVTIATNPNAIPGSHSGDYQWLVMLTMLALTPWLCLQQDIFARDDRIETVGEDWKIKELERKIGRLLKGVDSSDRYYTIYVALEVLLFLLLAAPLAVGLRPWLSGQKAELDYFWLGFNLGVSGALLMSWTHVRNANRSAARALQQEIDKRKAELGIE